MTRPSWDEYFMELARTVATRSTCLRRHVGAVIVKDKHILATGYNGAPRGLPHAGEVGCLREKMAIPSGQRPELCRGVHAEQNAITQAAQHGVAIVEGEIYCTTSPCSTCLKMIINAGIVRVVYEERYHDPMADLLAEESNIEMVHLQKLRDRADTPTP